MTEVENRASSGLPPGLAPGLPPVYAAAFSGVVTLLVFALGWLHVEVQSLRGDLKFNSTLLDTERKELAAVVVRRDVIDQAMIAYDAKIGRVADILEAKVVDLQHQIATVRRRQLEESDWRSLKNLK